MLAGDHDEARVVETSEGLHGAVGRAVVNDDDLEGLVPLSEGAPHGAEGELAPLIGGDDGRDEGAFHGAILPARERRRERELQSGGAFR